MKACFRKILAPAAFIALAVPATVPAATLENHPQWKYGGNLPGLYYEVLAASFDKASRFQAPDGRFRSRMPGRQHPTVGKARTWSPIVGRHRERRESPSRLRTSAGVCPAPTISSSLTRSTYRWWCGSSARKDPKGLGNPWGLRQPGRKRPGCPSRCCSVRNDPIQGLGTLDPLRDHAPAGGPPDQTLVRVYL